MSQADAQNGDPTAQDPQHLVADPCLQGRARAG
jgi:hypothetical protein